MDGIEAVASWFTPTVLFCFLNLIIGTIFIASTLKPPHAKEELQPPPPQLIRVPSFFERVKSFNLSKHQTQPPESANHAVPTEEVAAAHHRKEEEEVVHHHVTRSKGAPVAKVLQKSASEKVAAEREREDEEWRRPATTRERTAREGDEAVDEKADDFINRFRQQLKLQRLNSLLRGAGK